jgi:hypothetical protein
VLKRDRNAGLLVHAGSVASASTIEPIVDVETHRAALAILDSRGYTRSGREPIVHWLTGIPVCGVCGSPMKGKEVMDRTLGKRVRRYFCATRVDRTTTVEGRHPAIVAEYLEDAVYKGMAASLLHGRGDAMNAEQAAGVEALAARLRDVGEAREDIVALVASKALTRAQAAAALNELNEEQEGLERALMASQRALSGDLNLAALRRQVFGHRTVSWTDASVATKAIREAIEALDITLRRSLVQELVHVTVEPGRGAKRVHIEHIATPSLNEQSQAA